MGESNESDSASGWSFYAMLAYLFFEFGRPQDLLPGLSIFYLGALSFIALVVALLAQGRLDMSERQTVLFLTLLGFMVLFVPFVRNNHEAFHRTKGMVMTFVCYLSVITFADSLNRIRRLMRFWIAIHLSLAILGIMKGGIGIGGWLEDENDFCMELNVAIPFAFFLSTAAPTIKARASYTVSLGVYILANMATLSRGGFIGLASVGTYCWLRSSHKVVSAALVVLVVVLMYGLAPEKYWKEVSSITDDETVETGTGGERLYTWGIGWEMFLANPILGIGPGNFPWEFGQYENGRTFRGHSIAGRQAHSLYLTVFPELGLLGAFLIGAMLASMWKSLRIVTRACESAIHPEHSGDAQEARLIAHAIEASMIGFLVTSIFISTLYYPTLWVLLGFAVALRKAVVKSEIEWNRYTDRRGEGPDDSLPLRRKAPHIRPARFGS